MAVCSVVPAGEHAPSHREQPESNEHRERERNERGRERTGKGAGDRQIDRDMETK